MTTKPNIVSNRGFTPAREWWWEHNDKDETHPVDPHHSGNIKGQWECYTCHKPINLWIEVHQ